MAEIFKFVYTMILFASLFIIVVNVGGKIIFCNF